MRTAIIVVDNFYKDPEAIIRYAQESKYYYPYHKKEDIIAGRVKPNWMSSYFKKASECPFKSSVALIERLEEITGEKIDLDHWNGDFPVDADQNLLENFKNYDRTCRWNCCFQVKFGFREEGSGVHNHVTDVWNSVGETGWAGIIYLNKDAPLDAGLSLWKNKFGQPFEWMSGASHWELIDKFANICNRLILCRGDAPHSGGSGFGDSIYNGRLFQTFFFKTKPRNYEGIVPF